MELEKRGIKILLMVEHIDRDTIHGCCIDRTEEMPAAKTVYMIEPPTDVADYEIDSDGFMMDIIAPVITIDNDDQLLKHCAMVRLGSRIYFFGGISNIQDYCVHSEGIEPPPPPFSDELKLSVRFLDVDHLELGLCRAASLNAPKEVPCVFSARGMIYALGSSRNVCNAIFTLDDDASSVICSGIFERYDPVDDKWQLLPDPPLPFGVITKHAVTWCDSATLIGDRYVFMGNTDVEVFVAFDLDTQHWSLLPAAYFQYHFPYGSLCVDNSLYYLIGYGSYKFGTQFDTNRDRLDQKEARYEDFDDDDFNLQIVKRGPLLVPDDDPSKLFNNLCLRPRYKQLMTRLDQVAFLLDMNNSEWRDIFHLGGRFFCYVVTAQLYCVKDRTRSQPYCRGVWIDVLEEVELPVSRFRTLASFSYRIRTPFENSGIYIRCCAFGSVPDSWVKEPLKKKQVAKERETFKAEIQHDYGGGSKGQGDCNLEENVVACVKDPSKKKQVAEEREHDHGGGSKGQGHCNLEKIVAVAAGDEEIIRLKAELAKKDAELAEKDAELAEKDALVKSYELLFVADRITIE